MSERPPPIKVPRNAESPEPQVDEGLERLEEDTLDKRARSAAYRAVVEHNEHVVALNRRIDVIQGKLDSREIELHRAIPRIAELEQAQRTARLGAFVDVMAIGLGTLILGLSGFVRRNFPEEGTAYEFMMIGVGATACVVALIFRALFALFGWPKKPSE